MNTAVAVIFFNRLEPLKVLKQRLSELRPTKLYLISDGPRGVVVGEDEKVSRCRQFMTEIPWTCDVKRNFATENMGCTDRIFTGLNWVFEQEECAIIVEDDCLPELSFFDYAEKTLERYAFDKRVMSVCGSNPAAKSVPFSGQLGFSKYPMVWGWATWRRAWRLMDFDMKSVAGMDRLKMLRAWLGSLRAALYWLYVLSRKSPSWDYRWTFTCFKERGLNVLPDARLVDNVGMTPDSTHTSYNPYELPEVNHEWTFVDEFPTRVEADQKLNKWIEDNIYSRSYDVRLKWLVRKIKRSLSF